MSLYDMACELARMVELGVLSETEVDCAIECLVLRWLGLD